MAISLEAAARACRNEHGISPAILSDAIEGEARDIGRMHAALAREVVRRDRPFSAPVVLLSGGETTVTARGPQGRGGRNTELALALGIDLQGTQNIHALSADTDGIDGGSGAAGAFADSDTVMRLRAVGQDPADAMARHDSASAFDAAGDLFVTGPTHTNVNDFRAILVDRG